MKITKNLLLSLLMMSVSNTVLAKCDTLDSLQWLANSWISETENNKTVESWIRLSQLSFEGSAQTIDKGTGETLFSESLRIVGMGGEVFYLAKVKENPFPVSFKLMECTQERALFENLDHDFPQRIEYLSRPDRKLEVRVSGQEGRSFTVNYTKQDD